MILSAQYMVYRECQEKFVDIHSVLGQIHQL